MAEQDIHDKSVIEQLEILIFSFKHIDPFTQKRYVAQAPGFIQDVLTMVKEKIDELDGEDKEKMVRLHDEFVDYLDNVTGLEK
jgi:hypothetical protein